MACKIFKLITGGIEYVVDEPIGWDAVQWSLKRNFLQGGFSAEQVDGETPLKLKGVGCRILRDAYNGTGGGILPLLDSNKGFDFQITFSYGTLSGITFTELIGGTVELEASDAFEKTAVNIFVKRVSFGDRVRTRFETPINLESLSSVDNLVLPAMDNRRISMHGRKVITTAQWDSDTGGIQSLLYTALTTQFAYLFQSDYQLGLNNVIVRELKEALTTRTKQLNTNYLTNPALGESTRVYEPETDTFGNEIIPDYFFINNDTKSLYSGNFSYSFDIEINRTLQPDPPSNFDTVKCVFYVSVYKNDNILVNEQIIGEEWYTEIPADPLFRWEIVNFNLNVIGSFVADINPNDKFYFVLRFREEPFQNDGITPRLGVVLLGIESTFDIPNLDFCLTANVSASTSWATVYKPFSALDRIVRSITGEASAVQSTLFDGGCADNVTITNGFNVRDYTAAAAAANTCLPPSLSEVNKETTLSLIDFIEGFKPLLNIGFGFEGDVFRVEKKEYFYQDVQIIDLSGRGVADTITNTPAVEFMFNDLEFGYEEWQDELVNNLDEVSGIRKYISPRINWKSKKTLVSPFIASGSLIEKLRQSQFDSKASTTTDNDDDIFVISCQDTVLELIELKIEILSGVSNFFIILGAQGAVNPLIGSNITISDSDGNDGVYSITGVGVFAPLGVTVFVSPNLLNPNLTANTVTDYITLEYTTSADDLAPERDEKFTSITGVISPETIYNMRFSPVRNMLRFLEDVRGSLYYKDPTDILRFQQTEGNANVSSELSVITDCDTAGEVFEDGNIEIGTDTYFQPDVDKFSVRLSPEEYRVIVDACTGQVTGVDYGYITYDDAFGNITNAWILSLEYNHHAQLAKFEVIIKTS